MSRVHQLALDRPEEIGYWHIGLDGREPGFTWDWLDRRSSQLAGALADRGLVYGDRLAIGLRNSPQFMLSVFAAWKLGAVPVPVRWDLPDWELERVLAVIEPRVHLSAADVAWIDASEGASVPEFPDVVAPHTHGICSSGSTGTPKVILSNSPAEFNPAHSTPLAETWAPIPRPQRVLVLAPMYHVNAFATFNNLLTGDLLFVMEKFDAARALDVIERHGISTFTATPTMLQRMADVPDVDQRDLSSLVWITQGAAPMPPSLVHRWADLIGAERIVMAYGMTEGIGITALRGDEWMSAPRERRPRHARHRSQDPGRRRRGPPAWSGRRHLPALTLVRRFALSGRRHRPQGDRRRLTSPGATSGTSTTTATSTSSTAAWT